jgi:integrase/recombinase XerD
MLTKARSSDCLEIFIEDCRFRGLSQKTIKDYKWYLSDVERSLGSCIDSARDQIKKLILSKIESGQSPASANHYIRAMKAFHSFLLKEGLLDRNMMSGMSLVSMPEKLKPVLNVGQISKLISAIPQNGFFHFRDRIMILILWDTAIRLSELLNIKINDIDLKSKTIKVTGKGRKDRIVPFGQKTRTELTRYLNIRGDNTSEYLFCTRNGYPIIARNFQRTVTSYGKAIGVSVSPHLIRHSAATFLAKNEMPAQHIQILLGHSSLSVTQNYINRIVAQEGLQISHRKYSPGDRI